MSVMSDGELALLRAGRVNLAFFLLAEVGGEFIRLYAGVGDFPLSGDAIDTEGGTYTCAGRWGEGMPDVDHLLNGQCQALSLSLTGVDRETAKGYLLDRSLIIGAPAAMGWCVLDHRHQLGGPVRWPIRGSLTQPRVFRRKASETSWTRTVSVVLLSGPVGRRRPSNGLLTGPDQRRRHPTDAFCDGVGALSFETTRAWPN